MRKLSAVLLSILAVAIVAQAQEKSPVVRLDPALDHIAPPNAKVEKLPDSSGPGTREGPVWIRKGGYLIYSDPSVEGINKWRPGDDKVSLFLEHTNSNGITLDRQGRIVYAALSLGQIVRVEKDGSRTVLASQYESKPLNNPNDLVYKSDGSLYFTDPGHVQWDKDHKVVTFPDVHAVYLLKDGKLRLISKDMTRPNGLAFSPDEKYLYVNDTFEMKIMRFDVQPDDTISNGRLLIDMQAEEPSRCAYPCSAGVPDGMKVDKEGNVYCTGPGGFWIMSPAGKHLGTVLVPGNPANFTFGGADAKTLYLTSRPGLYRIQLMVPGIRP